MEVLKFVVLERGVEWNVLVCVRWAAVLKNHCLEMGCSNLDVCKRGSGDVPKVVVVAGVLV